MTFEEIVNRVPEVRIVSSTYCPMNEKKEMIGKEYVIEVIEYDRNLVQVDGLWFNLYDVRFLTPLSFNGKRIAIGDEVYWAGRWRKVYGFHWYDGEYYLNLVEENGSLVGDCSGIVEDQITNHRSPSDFLEVTLDEVAKKFGVDVSKLRIKE